MLHILQTSDEMASAENIGRAVLAAIHHFFRGDSNDHRAATDHLATMNVTGAGNATAVCVKIGDSVISDLLMSVYILAFIFGLIFNVLTLGPILQQVRRQNVLGIFLLSLSLSDMLFMFTIPLWINYYHQNHHWKLGVMSCSVAGFFYYSNMYISIYLLCCISMDRCLVVTYPFRSKTQRTSCCAWAQCVSIYAVVMVLHIMVLFNDNLHDAHDSRDDRCYETYPMERPVALFNLLRVGIGFLLPLLVLAVSYWKVLATVGQSPGLSAQVKRKNDNTRFDGSYCEFEQKVHFAFSCTLALSSLNCVVDPVLYVLISNGIQEDFNVCCKRCERTQMDVCAPSTHNTAKLNNHLI
ncbi:G protein-coupled receptor 184 isoform X3 [Phycodurus eques]|uniref:G protein-coupled receptor 184 isoform X3 n=1 Tax=Phycodurus eques TaxID=693459 RepID=UPI002ACDD3F7|nr:G protein-coupled receptor 184 isoform X3 [Phycodurus eques]